MTVPAEPRRPTSAIVSFGAIAFVAFTILGFGVVSYAGETMIIERPGVGPVPGVVGMVAATLAWIGFVAPTVRRLPGLSVALGSALVAGVVHGAAVTVAALGVGIAGALDIGAHLVLAGYSVVVALSALLAATGVAVLARSGGGTPKWPWEREEDE